jgi:hypothetical protein
VLLTLIDEDNAFDGRGRIWVRLGETWSTDLSGKSMRQRRHPTKRATRRRAQADAAGVSVRLLTSTRGV